MDDKIEKFIDLADKAYEDIKPAVKQAGRMLKTVFCFFDNVVLYPLKKLSITFEAKAEKFKKDVIAKYDQIPEENRQESPVNILGPTLEALRYNIDEEDLKEMFENIIINSMDNRIESKCHPAYIDIIKQMSSNDAQLLKTLQDKINGSHAFVMPRCKTKIRIANGRTEIGFLSDEKFPNYYIGDIENLTVYEISKSLENLQRLGLITIDVLRTAGVLFGDPYPHLEKSEEINAIYKRVATLPACELIYDKGNYEFTEFGRDFVKVCIAKVEQTNEQ